MKNVRTLFDIRPVIQQLGGYKNNNKIVNWKCSNNDIFNISTLYIVFFYAIQSLKGQGIKIMLFFKI